MYDAIALGIILITNTVLGVTVLSRNIKNKINRLYALLAIVVMCWTTANYFTNHVHGHVTQLIVNRMSFAAGLILAAVVWIFSLHFPYKVSEHKTQRLIAYILLPTVIALTFTPFIVDNVIYRPEKELTDVTTGSLYLIYVFTALTFFTFLFINFHQAFKAKTASVIERQQIIYSAIGILLTFVWILSTTAVIPSITNDWSISKIGIIGSLFLVSFIGYAIIRHKLFDIRLIVARALGYVFSLGAIVGIYSVLVFGLIAQFVDPAKAGAAQQFIYVALAIVVALTFPPIKRFFDKLSNKLFYQDAYEPQDLLNELNNLLVSQIELNKILKDGTQIIQKYLKVYFVQFHVGATDNTEAKLVATGELDNKAVQNAISAAQEHKIEKLLIVDDLPEEHSALRRQLQDQNVAAIVRLKSTSQQGREIGYLAMGIKRSGSVYNKQDVRMVSIMADELVIAIQNALRFEEIQQFNITLQQKIDDATRQLRKANDKLRALDETKDEFISMASHQLRTPLTSVKGYVSMVLEGDVGKVSGPQRKLLDQAFVSSQRMVYLIADLLNVSRLRTGKFIIENKPTNLADVVETEISQLTETAKGRNLELTFDKPKSFPTLMLDETKIRQVIMNFADNAIYYTPSGGHIQINLAETPKSVEFTVVDDGLGVPKHDQHHLFSKFFRAGNAKKARPDGTGLGLFMAKKVVIAQGGAIIFNSTEDKGSTFGFSFPKAKLKVNSVASQSK